MKLNKTHLYSSLIIVSLLIALIGLGKNYYSILSPTKSYGLFSNIAGDRWIQNGSQIKLPFLAPRGNRLLLRFGPWHPESMPPAKLQVSVCGKIASEFSAQPGVEHEIFLTGTCEPKNVEFKVLNPFTVSETDPRELGAQLQDVEIKSRLGIPILSIPVLLIFTLLILTLLVLTVNAFNNFYAKAIGVTLYAYLLFHIITATETLVWWKMIWPYIFLLSFTAGLIWEKSLDITIRRREVLSSFATLLCVLLIGILAFILRFKGLSFGLPSAFHPDEVPKFNAISRMLQYGDLNPRYFLHPTLLLYSTYFMNWLTHGFEVATDYSSMIYSGRIVSMLAGTFSVVCCYALATRLFNTSVGLLSALFLAIAPLHVVSSRYVKEDSLLLAFTLLTAWLVVKAAQDNNKKILFFAAITAGLTASVKYSGILSFLIIGTAPWIRSQTLTPDRAWLKATIFAICIMPVGFLIGTPYSLLDYQGFLKDFNHEKAHMLKGHSNMIDAWSQHWLYHFSRSIVSGFTMPLSITALLGFGLLSRRWRINGLFVICLFLMFYLPAEWVKAKPAPQPERYIVPCLPFLAIAAASFIFSLYRDRNCKILAWVLSLLLIILPFSKTLRVNAEINNDTRLRMANWIRKNIKKGSTIYIDWKPYSPQGLESEYDVQYLGRSNMLQSLSVPELKKLDGYLMMSSLYYDRYFNQPEVDARSREVIRAVFKEFKIIKHIKPKGFSYGFHNPRVTMLKVPVRSKSEKKSERIISEFPSYATWPRLY
jgi:4-amino-4-deoxy-L-arabinose transferase-like glycosyltransferase